MGKDEVFRDEIEKASDFKFGANVAKVFDDMVNRSVPFYGEIQRMMAELSANHAAEGSFVYDLLGHDFSSCDSCEARKSWSA